MKNKYLVLSIIIFFLVASPLTQRGFVDANEGHCAENPFTKVESSPFTASASSDQIISKIFIKAGSTHSGGGCFEYTSNVNDGCYNVSGIGSNNVTAVKVGDGRDCKDISFVEFVSSEENTPTPIPTEGPTPTVTLTPTLTPEPTATPTTTPTLTPTPIPGATSTPTPTLTPTLTPTSIPGATATPTSVPVQVTQTNNQTVTVNIETSSITPTPAPEGGVLGVTTLPKTGLPFLALAPLALIPIGLKIRKFAKGTHLIDTDSSDPNFIWEEKKFKKEN